MKSINYILSAIITLVSVCSACSGSKMTEDAAGCMYCDSINWYQNGKTVNEDLVDVFYVLPTCVFDHVDSTGQVSHYADIYDEESRMKMEPSYQLADEIFADSANFFAPYYRHISMNVWMEGEDSVEALFPKAMEDVNAAFNHYLKHMNNNRPFILAGYSQGAKCVVELIKQMDKETADRMIAAYVCGYRVTAADTAECKVLRPAQSATDTGVTIVYNTVDNADAKCGVVSDGNIFSINLASWTTDNKPHSLNDSVTITLDADKQLLIAKGVDVKALHVPSLATLFPMGNLHLQELLMYRKQLHDNVLERIKHRK